MIKIGIIGGSGYTGGELIRLLLHHPAVEIDFVYSRTQSGALLSKAHPDLLGLTNLCFTDQINPEVSVVFLCLGHGNSRAFLEAHSFSEHSLIIDLSTDFRHKKNNPFLGKTFVYGLPEKNKNSITQAKYIANPGCFATALQLALLPLAANQQLKNPVHINGTTGTTGAGVIPTATTHYSWRDNNLSWYKAFDHQHLEEVIEQLTEASKAYAENKESNWNSVVQINTPPKSEADLEKLAQGTDPLPPLYFIPQRGNFSRGIYTTLYTPYEGSLEQAYSYFYSYYSQTPFTHISEEPISLKQVVNTNQCHLHLHKHQDQLLITVAIDNLLKGASGQAIQNMNLALGLEEELGLGLKGSAF